MKKHKNKIIAGVVIAIVLGVVFWYGGDAPGLRGRTLSENSTDTVQSETRSENGGDAVQGELPSENGLPHETSQPEAVVVSEVPISEEKNEQEENGEDPVKEVDGGRAEENRPQKKDNVPMTPSEKEELAGRMAKQNNTDTASEGEEYSEENGMVIDETTGKDKYMTDPVPEGKPVPVEPQDAVISDKELTCTLSVRCDTILKNIEWLDKEKVEIVPEDGVIFEEKTVTFYDGESVFNLLLREMKKNKIHTEFENTPIYNSAYIEGIANIYEFDCGELSGWMYKVNDWFPNYGCSRYRLKEGDKVEWVYTCDLGIDVGGYYSARGGN